MNKTEAMDFFPGLEDGYTILQLKKAFRLQATIKHPDHGGAEEEFILLKEAYNVLKKYAVATNDRKLKTASGIPLSELGHGLSTSVNTKDCHRCKGKGYNEYNKRKGPLISCPDCDGSGAYFLKCKGCQGTGDYKHPKLGLIDCNLCGGFGRYYPPYKMPRGGLTGGSFKSFIFVNTRDGRTMVNSCSKCRGDGGISGEVKVYDKCSTCDGKGEIRIYNPVIPKGLLIDVSG